MAVEPRTLGVKYVPLYNGPELWNSTTAYPALAFVKDSDNNFYMSTAAVSAGTPLTNEVWEKRFKMPDPYIMPQATASALGGIKADTKQSIDTQAVRIDTATGKLYTKPGAGAYTLPQATASALGGIKADTKQSADTQAVRIDSSTGKLWTKPAPALTQATSSTLGGIKADPTQSGDTQAVRIDTATGKLYTKVPPASYVLPQATSSTLGGIKAYAKLAEHTQAVSIDESTGMLWTEPAPALKQATSSTLGGIKANTKISDDTQAVRIDTATGTLWTMPYHLPTATEYLLGGVKPLPKDIGDTTPVTVGSDGRLYSRTVAGWGFQFYGEGGQSINANNYVTWTVAFSNDLPFIIMVGEYKGTISAPCDIPWGYLYVTDYLRNFLYPSNVSFADIPFVTIINVGTPEGWWGHDNTQSKTQTPRYYLIRPTIADPTEDPIAMSPRFLVAGQGTVNY